jgi:hypothetical protein
MKLKVFKAFAAAWAFLIQHGFDVLRIIWLPVVLQIAAYFALMPGPMAAYLMLSAEPPVDAAEAAARLGPHIAPFLGFLLVVCAATIIMYAGLTRLIVRGEKPHLPFLLSWGADEWRLLGGWAIILALFIGVQIALAIVATIVQTLGLLGQGPATIMLSIVGVIIVVVAAICATVRLSLFAPATIAERKIGILVSWERTEDDFWNLLGFWLLWILLAVVVQFMTFGLVTPPEYFEAMQSGGFGSPEEMRETMRAANEALARGYDLSGPGNAMRMLIAYLISTASGIIGTVAGAVAWRMMTDTSSEVKLQPAP